MPTAKCPCEQLNGTDQHRQDSRSGQCIVTELRQKTARPVRQSSGDGGDASEVSPGGFEQLVLLLEMQVIRVSEGEEAVNGDAGQYRQGRTEELLRSGHVDTFIGYDNKDNKCLLK